MMKEQEINFRYQNDEDEEKRTQDRDNDQQIQMEKSNQFRAQQQQEETDNQNTSRNQASMQRASFTDFINKKQKNQGEEDNISQTVDEEVAGFHIIGEDSTNQVLQVNLYPKQKIFVRGKILYGNFNFNAIVRDYAGYRDIYTFLKEFLDSGYQPMRKIHNQKPHIVYFGISKSGGKILCIDNDIYGNDMCIRPSRVILSNVNHENSSVVKHSDLPYLQSRVKVNKKSKIEKTLTILQSRSNNVIIQKYLGQKETLYVQESLIMALSRTVKVEKSLMGAFTAKLQGPGWVFMENSSMSVFRQNRILTMIGIFLLYLFLDSIFTSKN